MVLSRSQVAGLPQTPQPTHAMAVAPLENGDQDLSTAYSLLLLSEYTHTLDSLPLDLSKNFADLRELDAVLSSSMTSITEKITTLTSMIEDNTGTKEDKLWLLSEISDEASRLKLGDEDKIRVACQAADGVRAHATHLKVLAEGLPGFSVGCLERKTVYPHVSAQSFMPVHVYENGRRRRNGRGLQHRVDGAGGVGGGGEFGTEDAKSPRKQAGERRGVGSRGGVKKATDRANSPDPKRRGNRATPLIAEYYDPRANYSQSSSTAPTNSNSNHHRTSTHRGDYAPGASSSSQGVFPVGGGSYDAHGMPLPNWAGGLEGPGMPVSRVVGSSNSSSSAAAAAAAAVASRSAHTMAALAASTGRGAGGASGRGSNNTTGGTQGRGAAMAAGSQTPMTTDGGMGDADMDADGDGDEKRYCFCNGVSYGEMIACDDGCEREWFHLACTGLSAPPSGKWYCDDCKAKRNARRGGRGTKRRTAGGRAGAKA